MYLTDFAMESKIEIIQINISGEDKPGMTSSLTDILARYDAFILDIGQANIHQSLTLGILFMTTSDKSGAILKELLFKASELGVMIRFTPITEEHYQAWVGRQGKNRYIITLLGRQVTARHIAGVTKAVAEQGLNIDAIKRLTGRMPLEEENRATRACIELSVRGTLGDKAVLQKRFMELSNEGVDISFQKDDIFRRSRRLICFDMDSTLIETEVIDELADRAGVGPEVRAVTESAMRGEIDFTESFTRRIALLRGLDVSVMEEIARNAQRIIVLDKGGVCMQGSPAEVFTRARELESIGLDVPQVTKIAHALHEKGVAIDPAVYTMEALRAQLLALKGGSSLC